MSPLAAAAKRWSSIVPVLLDFPAIAPIAIGVRNASGIAALNPVVVAQLIGPGLGALVGRRAVPKPSIAFAVKPLLGLPVTLARLSSPGIGVLLLAVAVVALTPAFTIGRRRLLTDGQRGDCPHANALIEGLATDVVMADTTYDAAHLRIASLVVV